MVGCVAGCSAGALQFDAILGLKGQQFDVIYIPGYYNEAGLIIKQARALGITAPIMGADGLRLPTLLDLAGADALNDVYSSNHYSNLDKDPKVQKFIADFKAKYNAEPGAFSALGYDTAYFVADAIKRDQGFAGHPEGHGCHQPQHSRHLQCRREPQRREGDHGDQSDQRTAVQRSQGQVNLPQTNQGGWRKFYASHLGILSRQRKQQHPNISRSLAAPNRRGYASGSDHPAASSTGCRWVASTR